MAAPSTQRRSALMMARRKARRDGWNRQQVATVARLSEEVSDRHATSGGHGMRSGRVALPPLDESRAFR
ncbi:hypothetical protein BE11_04430 [Sorangium cellulosum]|nr:hypothetical protein BE11_04430 [Sorangium cellulosum]